MGGLIAQWYEVVLNRGGGEYLYEITFIPAYFFHCVRIVHLEDSGLLSHTRFDIQAQLDARSEISHVHLPIFKLA